MRVAKLNDNGEEMGWMEIDTPEELRRDAERYRYLRANAKFQDRNGPGLYWYLPRGDRNLPLGERLDRSIDAEIGL